MVISASAQENPITFDKEIIYKVVYQPDSTNKDDTKDEYAELRLNDTVSIFRTIATGRLDSAAHNAQKGNSGGLPSSFYADNITDIHYTIVKKKDSIIHQEVLHPDLFHSYYYSEPKDILKWEIKPDTMIIENMLCQKATVALGGRKWIAWFAQDIPLPEGPYKFCNLPGLILSAYDDQGHWRFDIITINLNKHGKSWLHTPNGPPPLNTNKKDFFEKKVYLRANLFELLSAEGRFRGVKPERLEKTRKFYQNESNRDNNWIELYP